MRRRHRGRLDLGRFCQLLTYSESIVLTFPWLNVHLRKRVVWGWTITNGRSWGIGGCVWFGPLIFDWFGLCDWRGYLQEYLED